MNVTRREQNKPINSKKHESSGRPPNPGVLHRLLKRQEEGRQVWLKEDRTDFMLATLLAVALALWLIWTGWTR